MKKIVPDKTVVHIVACGSDARYLPLQKSKDLWIGINDAHTAYDFKPDIIIAMDNFARDTIDEPDYVKSIIEYGCPVLTSDGHEAYKNTRPYPLREAIAFLGDLRIAQKVLSNTANYALVYAALQKPREIWMHGYQWVGSDSSVTVRRCQNFLDKSKWPEWTIWYMEALVRAPAEPGLDGCLFLLGMLRGKGFALRLPSSSTLLDRDRPDFFYGYQEQPDASQL